jgi:hypothetical protein
MSVLQIVLARAFLPSPRTHTLDIRITYSPGQLIFQNTKTKVHPCRQLAILPLHCELHKLYNKWQAKTGCSTRKWRNPHEDHSWEKDHGAPKHIVVREVNYLPWSVAPCSHLFLKKGINWIWVLAWIPRNHRLLKMVHVSMGEVRQNFHLQK